MLELASDGVKLTPDNFVAARSAEYSADILRRYKGLMKNDNSIYFSHMEYVEIDFHSQSHSLIS